MTAATPIRRFIGGPPSWCGVRPRSGIAVEGLDRAPGDVSGRSRARDLALAIDLMVVARGDGRIRQPEQAAERPARALGRWHVDEIGAAVDGHVAGEAALVRAEVV